MRAAAAESQHPVSPSRGRLELLAQGAARLPLLIRQVLGA